MIYIITHKDMEFPKLDHYVPLLVGAIKHPEIQGFLLDSTGENISEKNDSYCELTGLYWMWKNTAFEYYGLVHYRRFFANVCRIVKHKTVYYTVGKPSYRLYEEQELNSMLRGKDLLVIESPILPYGNRKVLQTMTGAIIWKDLDVLIQEDYQEYWNEYKKSCTKHNHIQCNMFFGKRQTMEKYCQWLFPLLEKLDKMHVEETGDRYHNRELGYIGELLFDVWIHYNRIIYEVVDCITFNNKNNDQHQIKKIWMLPKDWLRNAYQWVVFLISKQY